MLMLTSLLPTGWYGQVQTMTSLVPGVLRSISTGGNIYTRKENSIIENLKIFQNFQLSILKLCKFKFLSQMFFTVACGSVICISSKEQLRTESSWVRNLIATRVSSSTVWQIVYGGT